MLSINSYILSLQHNSVVLLLEPVDGLVLGEAVVLANGGLGALTAGNTVTGTAADNVEVHTVDSDIGVVLDTHVDVLLDTETEVTGLREVALEELVLLDLEATLDDLLSLGATDGDVAGDLFVTTDGEGTDSVAGLGKDGGLTAQLLKHLGSTGETVTTLTDTDVKYKLLDLDLAERVHGLLVVAHVLFS